MKFFNAIKIFSYLHKNYKSKYLSRFISNIHDWQYYMRYPIGLLLLKNH
jgi:hypothetical protein